MDKVTLSMVETEWLVACFYYRARLMPRHVHERLKFLGLGDDGANLTAAGKRWFDEWRGHLPGPDQAGSDGAPKPSSSLKPMPHIYRNFTVCDLTTQMKDGRYMARVAVLARGSGRRLFQRYLDFGTLGTWAEATARAQAGARAWIDEQALYVPLALPTRTIQ